MVNIPPVHIAHHVATASFPLSFPFYICGVTCKQEPVHETESSESLCSLGSNTTDPISDHCCVLATFRLSCLPAKKTVMRRYNYSAADWPGLRSCLEHVPLEEVIAGTEDVNAAWSAWESRFLDIIRHYIPCHTITVRRKNKVWMNSTLHKLSRKKHRLFKRFPTHEKTGGLAEVQGF